MVALLAGLLVGVYSADRFMLPAGSRLVGSIHWQVPAASNSSHPTPIQVSQRVGYPATVRREGEPAPAFDLVGYMRHPAPNLGLRAASAILVDTDDHRVLYAVSPRTRRAPASLTKMMTAMVGVDSAPMAAPIVVSERAATAEPSRMGLDTGEVISLRDALYGALLPSGNDAAEAIASGFTSREEFLSRMNAKARQLRLQDTHFTSPSGLDEPGLYSSAYDLAVIATTLETQYPELAAITASPGIEIAATDTHKPFSLGNRNRMLQLYPGTTGGKTGLTDSAGYCIVTIATRNGRHLVAVILGSDLMYADVTRLLDWGWTAPGSPPVH